MIRKLLAGLTLVETIIGIFILTFAFMIIVQCFHMGMTQQVRTEKRLLAAQLARKKLAELRAWARQPQVGSIYNYDSAYALWAAQVGSSDAAYPGFNTTCSVVNQTLYSPCTSMEAPYVALGTARSMTDSMKKVKLTVGDPGDPGFLFSLVTLVGDPTRNLAATNAVRMTMITPVPAFLAPSGPSLGAPAVGSFIDMRGEALYPDGRVVPDIFFDWYVVPLGGSGTVFPSRDGHTCRFVNGVNTGASVLTTEGNSVVALHGQYRGQGEAPQVYDILIPNPYITISPVLHLGP